MRTKEFLSKLDHDRIVEAIRKEEGRTSGEIRVYIQRGNLAGDALAEGQRRFQRLGMHRTKHRNAVLIFIAPRTHKFAVIGDKAIHEKCGDALWQSIVARMGEHFRNDRFTEALIDAIHDLGATLAKHFPGRGEDLNDLPDSVVEE